MIIFALVLFIVGLFDTNEMLLIASGLFAIASSIDSFRIKYFKDK